MANSFYRNGMEWTSNKTKQNKKQHLNVYFTFVFGIVDINEECQLCYATASCKFRQQAYLDLQDSRSFVFIILYIYTAERISH